MALSLLGTAGILAGLLGAILLTYRGVQTARSDSGVGDLGPPAQLLLGGSVVAMVAIKLALVTNDFRWGGHDPHGIRHDRTWRDELGMLGPRL